MTQTEGSTMNKIIATVVLTAALVIAPMAAASATPRTTPIIGHSQSGAYVWGYFYTDATGHLCYTFPMGPLIGHRCFSSHS
jgi:hypothetical protein